MENLIQRVAVPSLTKAQQFLTKLLCGIFFSIKILLKLALSDENGVVIAVKEFYNRRSDKSPKAIEELESENLSLLEEKISLKAHVSQLIQEKSLLIGKLRATTNMLRILTKSKEDASNSCKTPIKINVSDVDCLLQKKLNKSTVGASNKKKIQAKSLPAKVVNKKEAKKVVVSKANETMPYIKNTQKKDTKDKKTPNLPLRIQSKILPKSPLTKKSAIFQGKGKENQGIKNGSFRITGTKVTENPESKTVLNTRTVKKHNDIKELKTGELKIHKKLDQTFIIKY